MTVLRLGAAQLHFHPAFVGGGQQPLREPLGSWEGAGLSGLSANTEEGELLLRALRERVEKAYVEAFRPRLLAVVRFAAGLDLDLLVLPELSVPLALLSAVAEAAGERMTVVAGSHTVTHEGARKSGLYEALGLVPRPAIGSAVAPVLRGGKGVAAQAKLSASRWEADLVLGRAWAPVPLGAVAMGVLLCIDFLKRADGDVAPLVAKGLDGCAVLAVPSLTPFASLPHFERGAEEVLYGYDRPVVYANGAGEGGTRVFTQEEDAAVPLAAGRAPVLTRGVEGVVAAEVRLGEARQRYRPVAASRPLAAGVLMDAGVWGDLRAAEEGVLAAEEAGEALDRIEAARGVFERAARDGGLPEVARDRWRYLAAGAEGTTSIGHLHALVRDVWVEGVSGHREMERGLLEGAARVLREVEKKAPGAQRVVTIRGWLEEQARGRFEGVEAAGDVVEAVTDGLVERAALPPPAPPGADGSFERWEREPGEPPARLKRKGFWAPNARPLDQGPLVLIEEPDLHLHPDVGRVLQRTLGVLALRGHPAAWMGHIKNRVALAPRDGRIVLCGLPPSPPADVLALLERQPSEDLPLALIGDRAHVAPLPLGVRFVEQEIRSIACVPAHLRGLEAILDSDEGARFIEPQTRARGADTANVTRHLMVWLSSNNPVCLLLGEFGTGKTMVAKNFAARQARGALKGGDRPVIFVDLRAWSGPVTIHGLVRRALDVENIAPYRFAVEEGECILILDGFDEMSNRLTPAQLGDAFRALLAWKTPRSKILLTCRTHLFIDPADLDRVLAEATGAPLKTPGLGEIEGATVLELRLFDKERILEYLHKVFGDAERAWEAMGKVNDLQNLAERPLLLDMIRENLPALTGDKSVSLGDLYESYMLRWAEWPGPDEWLTPEQKIAFAEELAFCVWNNGPEIKDGAIRVDQLSTVLFRGRKMDWIRRLDRDEVRLELRAGTFLVWQEGDEAGYYRFAHRSFLEYMLARRAVGRLGEGEREVLDLPRFSPEVIAYCKGRPGWGTARQEAAELLVDPYRARVSENALLLLASEQGFRSTAERPWRLEDADLKHLNLRGARLAGAWFTRANLFRTVLARADLRGARLEGAVLDGAADLGWADLRGAEMKGATARAAILDGTRFEGADLREVGFEGSSAFAEAPVLRGARLEGACITGTAWRAPAPGAELCGLVGVAEARWRGRQPIEQAEEGQAASRVEPAWHRGRVNGVAFSPDGTRIATVCQDYTGQIWEARTGRLLQTLQGHTLWVTSVAWAADGECLATGSADKTARVWEARTGQLLQTLQGDTHGVTSVAWAADDERLAVGSADNTAQVWEAKTGRLLQTLQGHAQGITSVAWARDGEHLATGSHDKTAAVWEARTGRLLQTIQGHAQGPFSVTWTMDGEGLITCSDRTVQMWEVRTGRLLRTFHGHTLAVTSVATTKDGEYLATGSHDKTARVWDVKTGRLLQTLHGHASYVASVGWTARGERLVTGSDDSTARVWEAKTGRLLQTFQGHAHLVTSVAWATDGERVATGSDDKIARVWETTTGRLLQTLHGHTGWVASVAWTADGERLATGSFDGTARVWEAKTGRLLQTLQGHTNGIGSVAWKAEEHILATGSFDGTVRVWEARTGQLLQTLQEGASPVYSVAWAADGDRLATGSQDHFARVWESKTGRLLQTLVGHTGIITSVAWAANGERLATGANDSTARVWEATTGRLLRTLQEHGSPVTSVAWAADGERLATGYWDATAHVWEATTGRLLQALQGHTQMITAVAWTADGKRLATGSHDSTARVWDIATAREIAAFLHTPIGSATFSGSYTSPTGGMAMFMFAARTGTTCAPLELYKDLCIRPDLIAAALAGKPVPPLHIPMDTAARMVEAAVKALLDQHQADPTQPIRSGTRTTIPFPWKLAPAILATHGFNWHVDIMSPAGAFQPVQAQLGHTLSLPELAPGGHKLVLSLQIGDRAVGNHHERRYTLPLTVLAHNPYIAGPPVRGADLIGRDADLARIRDKLRHGSIQLTGERRIGKTSILHHLADHPGAYAPVWLDAQELSDPSALRAWVTAGVREHLEGAPSDPTQLLSFLRRLAASGRTPLLLVDEISHLQGLSTRDAAWLRTLSTPPVAAVLSGSPFDWSRFFASLPDAAGSPFNHLQDVTLGPISDLELRRLVTRPGAVPPDEDAMRRIVELSGGRPYLAQRLCQAALDRVQREERLSITRADVDASAREALVVGLHHQHTKRWAELAAAPEVQRALADHARDGAAAPRRLYDALQQHGLFDGLVWTVDPAFVMWVREREAGA
jgi:WD40 repeat protein